MSSLYRLIAVDQLGATWRYELEANLWHEPETGKRLDLDGLVRMFGPVSVMTPEQVSSAG